MWNQYLHTPGSQLLLLTTVVAVLTVAVVAAAVLATAATAVDAPATDDDTVPAADIAIDCKTTVL